MSQSINRDSLAVNKPLMLQNIRPRLNQNNCTQDCTLYYVQRTTFILESARNYSNYRYDSMNCAVKYNEICNVL